MAAPIHDLFSFPPDFDIESLPNRQKKVCVVSIIGKSRYNSFSSKASMLNPVLDKDVFKNVGGVLEEKISKGDIECFYDADTQVVYLHSRCLHDTQRLGLLCHNSPDQDFYTMWQNEEFHHAKTMLLLFSISHIVLMSHPGSSFDISYVRLFRTLDSIRLKLQNALSDQLHGLPVGKDWYMGGRPCSPRVLFVFESATLDISPEIDADTGAISKVKKASPVKKLQHSIEDQIYRILRKSRIITNISNNSLFAVPANQEFVYIHGCQSDKADPVTYYLQQLRNYSAVNKDSDSPRSRSYQTNRRAQQGSPGMGEGSRLLPIPQKSGGENSFKEFLWQHIELAISKGFDDNVGRHPVTAVFELASCETWFRVATKLYNFFFSETVDSKAQPHFNTLHSQLETDKRFSENRCNKVLPLAESAYQEGLPSHYVTNYHLTKLAQARRVFTQFARGPASDKYLTQLEESCEKWWKNGHQLCEDISLTGNHCVNPLHRTPGGPETDSNKHLPMMPHSSQLKTKAACNCGRKQADKDDPFDHKAANYDFYESMEKTCCSKLVRLELPVFQPSTSEVRAGQIMSPPTLEQPPNKLERKESSASAGKTDLVTGMASLSLALSLGQSGGSDLFGHHEAGTTPNADHDHTAHEHTGQSVGSDIGHGAGTTPKSEHDHPIPEHPEIMHSGHLGSGDVDVHGVTPILEQEETVTPLKHPIEKLISPNAGGAAVRQHSTTEYLPGMIHTESPPGLLPKFPSWNICCLGKANLYSHSHGVDSPGFLHGSNFLLPWDITVRAEKDKWPTVGEQTASKKGKQKRGPKEVGEVTLRVFLGDEYECPRGHRFFCSGPEKIIKVSSTSTVKDNANKLVNLDMPLFCPCHCRSSKGFMAQLTRIYVVTPEGPAKVTIRPMVQPAPPPCPVFHTGIEEPIELPPGEMWVIRLPHIYLGERGAYTMPSDMQKLSMCRILKGVFAYKDLTVDG